MDFTPPPGPSTPFGTTGLMVLDIIRVIVMLTGLAIVIATPIVISRSKTLGQKVRFGATALLIISVIGTEYDHLGDYAHWRLLVHTVALVFAAWGTWSVFEWETPSGLRTDRDV